MNNNKTTAYEANVKELCHKIDTLEGKVKYYQGRYRTLLEQGKDLEKRLILERERNQTNMFNVIAILEKGSDAEGNIIISKEDKSIFVEMFKPKEIVGEEYKLLGIVIDEDL